MRFTSIRILSMVLAVAALAACDVSVPSQVKTGQMRLRDTAVTQNVPAQKPDRAGIVRIVEDYKSRGKGGIMIVMPYVSGNGDSMAAAKRSADAYRGYFAAEGVSGVEASLTPVDDAAAAEKAVVFFAASEALPAKGCEAMLDVAGSGTMADHAQYPMGCGVQTAFSKMIERPEDLMGTGGAMAGDESRRHGKVVEDYKAGKKNDPIQGMNASDVGR